MQLVAGVDEAGRGPLAGPVVASAVILKTRIDGLRDSKKLSPSKRDQLYITIKTEAFAWSLGFASVREIDQINILQATLLAMKRAIMHLPVKPDGVWVDGNQAPDCIYPVKTLIGGDDLKPCISAASIIAKVTRDRLMERFERRYPGYGFHQHKGYGTAQHMKALKELGATPIHRRSFAPVQRVLLLETV